MTTYRDRYKIASILSLLPLSLPRIIALFGSDKQRNDGHSYGRVYHTLFRPFRYKPVRLLEIGLLSGDSILAWRCFFPFGTTIGIDIEPKGHLAGKRTRVYQADQASAPDLDAFCTREGPFDIIIDDGSHYSRHQLFSFHHLLPHLKDGGLYVIEDVQTSFWSGTVSGTTWDGNRIDVPEFRQTCYGEFLELAKYLNHAEFMTLRNTDAKLLDAARQIARIAFEHNIITIWKGQNSQPSNVIRQDGTISRE
jgi:demethylmacrocin O-methyltransferase